MKKVINSIDEFDKAVIRADELLDHGCLNNDAELIGLLEAIEEYRARVGERGDCNRA